MKKKKIVIIDHSLSMGGGQWSSVYFAEILKLKKPEITLEYIVNKNNLQLIKSLESIKIKSYPIDMSTKNLILRFINIFKCLKKIGNGSNLIIYANTTEAGFWSGILKILFGYKYIFRVRLSLLHHHLKFIDKFIDKFILNNAKIIFANSKYVKQGLLDKFGPKIFSKTHDVYNYTPFPEFINKKKSSIIKVGLIGRFESIKRQLDMVEISEILSKLAPNKFEVFLIGKPDIRDHGEYFSKVSKKINELGLNKIVKILTNVNNPAEVYSNLDICVTLSKYEALSRVIFEASAAGVINLAVDSGSNGELISSNIDGVLSSPDDKEAIARDLSVLINNYNQAYQMAESSFAKLREVFSFENTVDREIKLILKLFTNANS